MLLPTDSWADPRCQPWFPGLAAELADRTWRTAPAGLSPATYGSLRWLTTEPTAPREIVGRLSLPAGGEALVELPLNTFRQRYRSLGLEFDASVFDDKRGCFEDAIAILNRVPGVGGLVGSVWRSTHLIAPQGTGYDASYSDPELPFSIFVSASPGEDFAALRLAENILHECLHLQLTLIEQTEPLVVDDSWTAYSPWQDRERPLSGLLHGSYVFVAIDAFWAEQMAIGTAGDTLGYASRRRTEIEDELALLPSLTNAAGLSEAGRSFGGYLQNRIACRSR